MNGDLISRKELRKEFKESGYFTNAWLHWARLLIDQAPTVFTDAILEAYSKITDQEFEHSNGFWIMTPKGKKIYFEKKRPQSEWIKGPEISRTMIGNKVECINYKNYTCSNCSLVLDRLLYRQDGSPFYKFCPNCGADMRGVENA